MLTNKVDILAFGAHPDDVECAAAGVLLKHIALSKTALTVELTAGEICQRVYIKKVYRRA